MIHLTLDRVFFLSMAIGAAAFAVCVWAIQRRNRILAKRAAIERAKGWRDDIYS